MNPSLRPWAGTLNEAPHLPLVELLREFDDVPWHGFVVAESPALVVLHRVSDRYDLDGYCAFPRDDIVSMSTTFERQDLIQRALVWKRQGPRLPPALNTDSLRELMASAQSAFGVLVIEREKVHPDEVEVGTVRIASEDMYILRWLTVDAEWENDDRPFRYRDVTKLEFGTEYEQTLLAVARSRGTDDPAAP
ncbi:MAG: hypothetical protein V4739_05800 [Pseudomonadota bacterium]